MVGAPKVGVGRATAPDSTLMRPDWEILVEKVDVAVGLQPLFEDAESASRFAEKCSKSHLLEMVVVGEREVESFCAHGRIRRAVSQGPVLVCV